ncbi:hypothetical protein H0I31_02895 [Tenacibaculum sp. AHE15PA]|uniref:hypothetical protein n=1 Tax=unclassified Tenacibaculum TaxID=2635139 RepID=UPI001C4E36DB|nr:MULTISPECIES: hypothetical protein [unclassified Tenacibaculum]QXP72663.1 hypothetical protein H0I30_08155 [Tenacibaculum sp. AHE14PA]QXP76578.1 hypothetical protein H0I31_02895 [Tenacibaculum sp. AHE15PA]
MKKITILILLLSSFNILSQNIHKIDSAYVSYFENTRETPYLHLNKTSFLKGEEIWFQAYVIEQNSKKLHKTTSNLYVSIFNDQKQIKDQFLIHIKKGIGKGSITLDSTFTEGNYYIKASTNWMKNFKESNSYNQKIKIISSSKKDKKLINEENFYEFKILPEGGHVLENTINNLGILIKDKNGNGIKIKSGNIKNKSKKIITTFKTNSFGLGNVNFFFKKNESYEFEAMLENGIIIKAAPPESKKNGLNLRVVNSNPKFLSINLKTNKNSVPKLIQSDVTVFIHNTNKYKKFKIKINEKSHKYALLINKNELPFGLNTITVFNNNKPILERLIFINNESLFSKIETKNTTINSDSLEINLKNTTNETTHLSTSFLPLITKAYAPQNSIVTSTFFKPFIKGDIQNYKYYLTNINQKKLRDLDLLLITQGWTKYNWNDIFNNTPKTKFNFENGINIILKSNTKSNNPVLMYSPENKIVREIKSLKTPYVLKNTFIKKNSVIKFGIKSQDNIFETTPILSYSKNSLKESLNYNYKTENSELDYSSFKYLPNDFEFLNEVMVKANKRKTNSNVYLANSLFNSFKMKDIMIGSGETVMDFITYKTGKRLNTINDIAGTLTTKTEENISKGQIVEKSSRTRHLEARAKERANAMPGSLLDLAVIINGNNRSHDPSILEGMLLEDVEEISFGNSSPSAATEVHIKTLTPLQLKTKKTKMSTVKLPYGFSNDKEYYNPKYPSYSNKTYQHFGAVYWKSNIKIPANSSISFKIPKNQQKKIKMFIEGMSEKGKVISEEIILK